MAKKEARRAARQTGQKPRAGMRPPTVRRSLIQGAILAVLYLVLVRWVFNTEERELVVDDVVLAGIFLFMYAGLIHVWERFLYNRRLRKEQESGEGEKKE